MKTCSIPASSTPSSGRQREHDRSPQQVCGASKRSTRTLLMSAQAVDVIADTGTRNPISDDDDNDSDMCRRACERAGMRQFCDVADCSHGGSFKSQL